MGFVVDAVSDVYNIPVGNLQPPPDFGGTIRTDYVRGLAMVDEKMVILLDVDYLVASDVAMIDAEEPAEIAESLAE